MLEQTKRDVILNHLFQSLLRLHKALLDDERVSYERVHGRISSNGAFLQLALTDAWFAWLRPLSQAIAKLDELNESDDTSSHEAIPGLLTSVQALLTPTEEGEGFGRHYYDALQKSPEIVLAHAAVRTCFAQAVAHKG